MARAEMPMPTLIERLDAMIAMPDAALASAAEARSPTSCS